MKSIKNNSGGIKDGIRAAYKCLLHSIESKDFKTLDEICEKNLSQGLKDQIEELSENNLDITLLNKTDFSKMKVRVVDYNEIFGAQIQR